MDARRWQHVSTAPMDGTFVELRDASARHMSPACAMVDGKWVTRDLKPIAWRAHEWRARR